MNNQSPNVIPNVPGLPNMQRKSGPNKTVIMIVLGAAAVLFLALWIVAIVQAGSNANAAKVARQQGIAEGQKAQATDDETKFNTLVNSPLKIYKAPAVYGGLEVSYPKTWNASVTESSAGTSLNLLLSPDVINTAPTTNFAARVVLSQALLDTAVKQYDGYVKKGDLKASDVMVSGISAKRFDGKWDGKHDGAVTLLQVRDKVIAIFCDDKQYLAGYNDIVNQFKVSP